VKGELVIGRVRSSFGKDGEIKVESLSGETSHFSNLRSIILRTGTRTERFEVERVRPIHRAILMKLVGVDTPEAASTLRGREIVVDRALAVPLEPGEYYYADLDGLEVRLAGSAVGRVAAIWESGSVPLLELVLKDGSSRLVPFQSRFFGDVDLENERIELLDEEILE